MAHERMTRARQEALSEDIAANEPGMLSKRAALQVGDELKMDLKHITLPGDKMLVQELDAETMSAGGIILPDMSKQRRTIAKVLKLSPQLAATASKVVRCAGRVAMPTGVPALGDYVTYGKYVTAAAEMEEIGPRVCVLNFEDVLAVLKPEAIENGKEDPARQAPPSGSAPNPVEDRNPDQETAPGNPQGVPRRD